MVNFGIMVYIYIYIYIYGRTGTDDILADCDPILVLLILMFKNFAEISSHRHSSSCLSRAFQCRRPLVYFYKENVRKESGRRQSLLGIVELHSVNNF